MSSNKQLVLLKKWLITIVVVCIMLQLVLMANESHKFLIDVIVFASISALFISIAVYSFYIINKGKWSTTSVFLTGAIATICVWVSYSLYLYLKIPELGFHNSLATFSYRICVIGALCTLVAYLWLKIQHQHLELQEKEKVIKIMTSRAQAENAQRNKELTLNGQYKKSLILMSQDLLYVEASGNYVVIHYTVSGKMLAKKLRTSLRQIEGSLDDSSFVRCHSGFIINLCHAKELNSDNLVLDFEEIQIPISRNYKANVQKQLSAIGIFD